jgi:hypothetical protein
MPFERYQEIRMLSEKWLLKLIKFNRKNWLLHLNKLNTWLTILKIKNILEENNQGKVIMTNGSLFQWLVD